MANIEPSQYPIYQHDLPDDHGLIGSLAIDTETMGLNPHRDRLCLIQMADATGQVCFVQRQGDAPRQAAPNLTALLEDKHRLKLFHYARFDIAMLQHYLDCTVRHVYCTKIASKLVRTYASRHGLKELVSELLGESLDKQQQASDWGREALEPAQLRYAAADVIYLHQLRDRLQTMIKREGREELLQACLNFLPARVALDLQGWADMDIFSHS